MPEYPKTFTLPWIFRWQANNVHVIYIIIIITIIIIVIIIILFVY